MSKEYVELKEGFTLRVFVALVYSALILTPIIIYTQLVTPIIISPIIIFIIFVEFSRYLGKPLTLQEAFLIYFCSGMIVLVGAVRSIFWLDLLFRHYLAIGPFLRVLMDPTQIPRWWLPPLDSEAFAYRTFLHPDWILPVVITLIPTISLMMASIALSYVLAQLYIEVERLPFPVAQYQAELIRNMVEREPKRFGIFILGAIFGLIYGTALYGLPMVTLALFGKSYSFPGLQVPWNDLTPLLEIVLPGAILGVMPDALAVTTSWVIPRYIIITIAITSLSIYLIGNHLALRLADVVPIKAFQFWKEDWFPGAGLMLTFTNSYRDLWINAHISVSIMAAIVSLLAHRRAYARAFRNLWVLPEAMKKAGYISLKILLTLYLLSCSMVIALIWFLVPDFPLYLILPLVVWELMFTFIYGWGVGAIGLAGAVEPPYMREGILIFSAHYLGYKKMDIWLAPWMINPGRDAALLLNNAFRVGYWCGCKPSSYIKAMIVANVLWTISALAFTELFWKMAPIPSAAYPWAAVSWALAAVRSTYFPSIALGKMIRPVFHVDMFILGIIIGLVAILLFKLFKTPLTAFIGVVSGLTIAPPIALSLLIGLLLGLVAERFKGREWWRTYRTSIIAGIALGEGIVIALGGALMLIVKSIWISPY